MSLVTVGSVAFDAIETPFGKTDKIIGGAGTYIAFSSSYFMEKQNIVSVVGEDFPQEMLDKLKNKGVNLEGLQIKEGEKTFFWSGKYSNDMNCNTYSKLFLFLSYPPSNFGCRRVLNMWQHAKCCVFGSSVFAYGALLTVY